MKKVKLTELYDLEEGNIAGNPELADASGSMTYGHSTFDPYGSTPNMNPGGPSGPAAVG